MFKTKSFSYGSVTGQEKDEWQHEMKSNLFRFFRCVRYEAKKRFPSTEVVCCAQPDEEQDHKWLHWNIQIHLSDAEAMTWLLSDEGREELRRITTKVGFKDWPLEAVVDRFRKQHEPNFSLIKNIEKVANYCCNYKNKKTRPKNYPRKMRMWYGSTTGAGWLPLRNSNGRYHHLLLADARKLQEKREDYIEYGEEYSEAEQFIEDWNKKADYLKKLIDNQVLSKSSAERSCSTEQEEAVRVAHVRYQRRNAMKKRELVSWIQALEVRIAKIEEKATKTPIQTPLSSLSSDNVVIFKTMIKLYVRYSGNASTEGGMHKKINAIKLVKNCLNTSLHEAKDFVDDAVK